MKNIKEYKRIINTPKYNGGKPGYLSSGYQSSSGVDLSGVGATPMYDMSNDVAAANKSILPGAIGKVGLAGTQVAGLLNPSNYISTASAASKNIASATTKGFVDNAGTLTEAGVTKLGSGAVGDAVTGDMASKMLGSEATKKGLTSLGKVAAGAGAALSAFSLVNDTMNFGNTISGSDLQNMSATSYGKIGGRTYKLYDGFDANGVMNQIKAQNKADTINTTLDGASLGFSVGSFFPGLGNVIGAGIGALGGLVGGLFGSSSRKKKQEEIMRNVENTMSRYNKQQFTLAANDATRDEYNATHFGADKGKTVRCDNGKPAEISMVRTENGIEPGYVQGMTQGGEGVYNTITKQGSINPGNDRNDNIPTGTSLNNPDPETTWNASVVFGNKKNPYTGNTFKEDAKPWLKALLSKGTSKTDMKNKENAKRYLDNLAKTQHIEMMGNKMSYRKYDDGKINQYLPMIGYAAGLPEMIGMYLNANRTLHSFNSYTPNSSANAALNIMRDLHVNPSRQIDEVNRTTRQGLYNLRNAGNLSGGMRKAMSLSYLNDRDRQVQDLINASNVQNNQYKSAYASMLGEYGEKDVARQQAARESEIGRYAAAVGTNQQLQDSWYSNSLKRKLQLQQDLNTADTANRMLNLYYDQHKFDKEKFDREFAERQAERQAAKEAAAREIRENEAFFNRQQGRGYNMNDMSTWGLPTQLINPFVGMKLPYWMMSKK